MAATALDIEKNPKFQELVATRKTLGWTLSAAMLAIYFGFILLVAFNKDLGNLLGIPLAAGSVTTVGIVVGLFVIVSAFVLTGIYVLRANARYDELTRQIVEESK
ncbi:hypothetical protein CCR94_22355 [Rhodoblastus sphagnicola]|uniref:DUF485 domain-containing protein n=1 Tax=Rhodoblastus sphagnicola TaxID=333368 RepID=A0A2S6MVI8_9HYPH|nr:DUF485 domain-containing protein [Rhodoblastus sphagnicola]MBB4197520.1 uncharacterized membrane protein (DUF485 family) [Rhodoblastus sphagnicola]PPQ26385.1 hypothetical protein CCR94_22355 [Rhodoblastus sphagnicola]